MNKERGQEFAEDKELLKSLLGPEGVIYEFTYSEPCYYDKYNDTYTHKYFIATPDQHLVDITDMLGRVTMCREYKPQWDSDDDLSNQLGFSVTIKHYSEFDEYSYKLRKQQGDNDKN